MFLRCAHLLVGLLLCLALSFPAAARPPRVASAKAKTSLAVRSSQPIVRPAARGRGALHRFFSRHLGIRQSVKDSTRAAREQARLGEIAESARTITRARSEIHPTGLRERFALWRAERTVKKTAFRMANRRSRAGDTVGTRDALDGLRTLKDGGRLGTYARWKAARAEGRAFRRSLGHARRAGKYGDLALALDHQTFAANLRGTGHKKVRASARTLLDSSLKVARYHAREGNADAAWQSLQYAAEASERAGVPFPQARAEKLMQTAFSRAVPRLVKLSASLYRSGAHDQAAAALYEAIQIQKDMGIRPGALTRMRQRGLTQKMMPLLKEIQRQQIAAAPARAQ